ncbi:MAG: hypothetical protein DMD53_07835 [Gemmatimonadetes bacterium]|nr:MAG: hypothetical protein DMD53_07835 [Gemmatimonadota bacterium]
MGAHAVPQRSLRAGRAVAVPRGRAGDGRGRADHDAPVGSGRRVRPAGGAGAAGAARARRARVGSGGGVAGRAALRRGRASPAPEVRQRRGARRVGLRPQPEGHGRLRRPGDRYQTAARRVRGPRAGLGERMSVTRDDVLKIAQLAELDVDEATLPLLAEQMSRILDYVAQIGAVAASEGARPFVPGPDAARFRPDEVRPWPLAFGPQKLAPAFKDGFFLVPKLGQFEEAQGLE